MAKRRVRDGKRVERETVTTADGRKITIDVYMIKGSSYLGKATSFVAICDEIDLEEKGDDIDEVTKRAIKLAKARSDVTWEPWLYVTVKGSRKPSEDQLAGELFDPTRSHWSDRRTNTSMEIEVQVEAIQRAEIDGKPKWRNPPSDGDKSPTVRDGVPQTGREPVYRYDNARENKPMRSLVRDTPEMRAALVEIRHAFSKLEGRLSDLLSPDKVDTSLARIYAGAPPLALPSASSADDVPGAYPAELATPPLEEPVKGKVRTKKAWIGTRPPSEGGNGPRG